jgi:hypothetical protein
MRQSKSRLAALMVIGGKSISEAAALAGVGTGVVRATLSHMGVRPCSLPHIARKRSKARAKWDGVDWRLRDTDIANQLGITRERVRQVRRSRGEVNAVNHRGNIRTIQVAALIRDRKHELDGLHIADIEAALPIKTSRTALRDLLIAEGISIDESRRGDGLTADNLIQFTDIREDTGCWEWKLDRNPAGYGCVTRKGGGGNTYAHRRAYELCRGEIPPGLMVLHRCDNPCCVNPEHLYIGTPKDNARDRTQRGRNGKHLTPADVEQIRLRFQLGGVSKQKLAEKYGVCYATINNLLVGRTHKTTRQTTAA